jgi:MFS family permease
MLMDFVLYIGFRIIFAGVIAVIANKRGRDPYGWFIFGWLGQCFAILLLFILPNLKEAQALEATSSEDKRRLKENRLFNFVGIFIVGPAIYTVLFYLGFPQYCIHFVPGMDQKDAALGIYMLGIAAYPSILPFWMVLWYFFFKWCDREPAVPPTNPE